MVTPDPTAETSPMPSWPGINGSVGFSGQSPRAAWRSVWQTPGFRLDQDLAGAWNGDIPLLKNQGLSEFFDDGGMHLTNHGSTFWVWAGVGRTSITRRQTIPALLRLRSFSTARLVRRP